MKSRKYNFFTLVELLVVIGIIVILAGILIPAVTGASTQARITQAKADMATLTTALRQVEATYGKMVASTAGRGGRTNYAFNNRNLQRVNNSIYASDNSSFDGMISELSNPSSCNTRNINKRSITFLDARDNNWSDPWGNRYVVIFCVDGSNEIQPHDVNGSNSSHTISTDLAIYSLGPNATDDHGCNKDDNCENISNADDIGTWQN